MSRQDFEHILTSVSNIIFSLVLIWFMAHEDESIEAVLSGVCVTMATLLLKLIMHRIRLDNLSDALLDINENRVSKFELALLLTKFVDDITVEDVQYNFTEHFYTNPLAAGYSDTQRRAAELFPDIEPLDDEDEADLLEQGILASLY